MSYGDIRVPPGSNRFPAHAGGFREAEQQATQTAEGLIRAAHASINETFSQLDHDVKKLREQTVILLGATGSGKTTLVHALAGNSLLVHGEEDDPRALSLRATKKMKGFIIGETYNSETSMPHVCVCTSPADEKQYAVVDVPGFDETRGVGQEIANAVGIQEVLKRHPEAKLVVVTEFGSMDVQKGNGLARLVSTLSVMFEKNIEKLIGAVSLVVTRTDEETTDGNVKSRINKLCAREGISGEEGRVLEALSQRITRFKRPEAQDIGREVRFDEEVQQVFENVIASRPIGNVETNICISPESGLVVSNVCKALKNTIYQQVCKVRNSLDEWISSFVEPRRKAYLKAKPEEQEVIEAELSSYKDQLEDVLGVKSVPRKGRAVAKGDDNAETLKTLLVKCEKVIPLEGCRAEIEKKLELLESLGRSVPEALKAEKESCAEGCLRIRSTITEMVSSIQETQLKITTAKTEKKVEKLQQETAEQRKLREESDEGRVKAEREKVELEKGRVKAEGKAQLRKQKLVKIDDDAAKSREVDTLLKIATTTAEVLTHVVDRAFPADDPSAKSPKKKGEKDPEEKTKAESGT